MPAQGVSYPVGVGPVRLPSSPPGQGLGPSPRKGLCIVAPIRSQKAASRPGQPTGEDGEGMLHSMFADTAPPPECVAGHISGDDTVPLFGADDGGRDQELQTLLSGERRRWSSLDGDVLSAATTLTRPLPGTPDIGRRVAAGGRQGKPSSASSWDGRIPGSLDASDVDALLLLIQMSGSPRSRSLRSDAQLQPPFFDMELPDCPSPAPASKRESVPFNPPEPHGAGPRHAGAHRRTGGPAAAWQQHADDGCEDLDRLLEVRARREMWRLNPEDIVLDEKLGEGDCAVVHKARWKSMAVVSKQLREVNEYTAIDAKPGDSPPTASASCLSAERARADLANEVHILSHLRHPNLVLFLGACITEGGGLCLVSEYMEGGTLESLYQREQEAQGHPFCPPRDQVLAWAQDLSQALCFLHSCEHPVIHRDIKPANLLLCRGILKVGDFGLSKATRCCKGNRAYRMTGRTGTMRYMAPEVMMMDIDGTSSYDEKVDIYSAACIIWFMCMGEKPFGDLPAETVMQGVTRGLRPDLYSVEHKHGRDVAGLIRDGWAKDPRDRMSGEEMVARVKMARAGGEVKCGVEQRKLKGSKGMLVSPLTHAKKMWSRVTRRSQGSWISRVEGRGDTWCDQSAGKLQG